jgi:8-oxo-dGTP diphosphatase
MRKLSGNHDNDRKQVIVFLGCLLDNGRVLMFQRAEEECAAAHHRWDLPGGKVDFGETPQEAVGREFLEETGIEVSVGELLPHAQVNYWDYNGIVQQTIVLCFRCEFVAKRNKTNDHHVRAVEWIPLGDVEGLELLPGIGAFVKLAS